VQAARKPSKKKAAYSPEKQGQGVAKQARAWDPPPVSMAAVVMPPSDAGSSSGFGELATMCLQYLTHRDLSMVGVLHSSVASFLNETPRYGHIACFLMSDQPLQMFARVVQLRSVVYRIMESRFGLDTTSFSVASIASSPAYAGMPHDWKALIHQTCTCFDYLGFPCVSLLDQVMRARIPSARPG